MYKTGDLQIETEPPFPDPDSDADPGMYDSRGAYPGSVPYPAAFLPHSCDRWVIGGVEQVLDLMHDLNQALLQLQAATVEKATRKKIENND